MTEPTPNSLAVLEAEPALDPYALLAKPTLELSDTELEAVVEELRKRRKSFILGVADKAPKPKVAKEKKIPAGKVALDASEMGDLF